MVAMGNSVLPSYPFKNSEHDPFLMVQESDVAALGGDIGKVRLMNGSWAWLFTKHEHTRELLRHPGFSVDPYLPGFPLMNPIPATREDAAGMFIFMDGLDHSRLRRTLTSEFMIKNIRRIEPLIRQTINDTLATLKEMGPPADFLTHFAFPVQSMTISHLLGVPYEDHPFFQDHSRVIMDRKSTVEEVNNGAAELAQFMAGLIERKRREPAEDLLSRLVVKVNAGELTTEELVAMSMLLLIAGHETSANMLGLSALTLLQHPQYFRALAADPSLAPNMVEELLRYLTVVRSGLPRLALEDAVIGGQRVAAGEGAIAMVAMANHDESAFADADTFDPMRSNAHRHMAFGFGVHQCIGQPLARAELQIALVELVQQFPNLQSVRQVEDIPTRETAVTFGLDEFIVTW